MQHWRSSAPNDAGGYDYAPHRSLCAYKYGMSMAQRNCVASLANRLVTYPARFTRLCNLNFST